MILPPSTHWIAAQAFERMLYCLAEGTALAAVVAVALRLIPARNSRSRFVVWFTALWAVVLLPFFPMAVGTAQRMRATFHVSASSHPLLTLSGVWAESIIVAWAGMSTMGLLRVFGSLWQLRRLRRTGVPIDPQVLGRELQSAIQEFQKQRPVSVLVSPSLEVPTAIGFLRPAILIPAWLAESCQTEEMKYVLLHEMAHLRHWDDWTNLAQKLVKAFLFFHPGVWWIERKLSLDREMACDDAVLAQTGNPRLYAQCLARVAEKSFLRRQVALAQAAVDRVRQLSLRVSRILDGNCPRSTRLWKPAVPLVAALALLCAVSASNTKDLVAVSDDQPAAPSLAASPGTNQVVSRAATMMKSGKPEKLEPFVDMAKFTLPNAGSQVSARPLEAKSRAGRNFAVPASYKPSRQRAHLDRAAARNPYLKMPGRPDGVLPSTGVLPHDREDGFRENGVVLLVVTSGRMTSAGSMTWQINMWELRWAAPANGPTKPIPHKT